MLYLKLLNLLVVKSEASYRFNLLHMVNMDIARDLEWVSGAILEFK